MYIKYYNHQMGQNPDVLAQLRALDDVDTATDEQTENEDVWEGV